VQAHTDESHACARDYLGSCYRHNAVYGCTDFDRQQCNDSLDSRSQTRMVLSSLPETITVLSCRSATASVLIGLVPMSKSAQPRGLPPVRRNEAQVGRYAPSQSPDPKHGWSGLGCQRRSPGGPATPPHQRVDRACEAVKERKPPGHSPDPKPELSRHRCRRRCERRGIASLCKDQRGWRMDRPYGECFSK